MEPEPNRSAKREAQTHCHESLAVEINFSSPHHKVGPISDLCCHMLESNWRSLGDLTFCSRRVSSGSRCEQDMRSDHRAASPVAAQDEIFIATEKHYCVCKASNETRLNKFKGSCKPTKGHIVFTEVHA